MSSTDTAVMNDMILYHKCIAECYSRYSDARTKLEPYQLIFNEDAKPKYPEFWYDDRGEIIREEFEKCVKIVHECLMLFPFLKADH